MPEHAARNLIAINETGRITAQSACMWPYYPDLLRTPVPRYTSYPTAAEFGPVAASAYEQALEHANGDISLYVHIPFCQTICHYCGCNTSRANRQSRLTSYLDALHHEIALVGGLLPDTSRIRRVSFGGGSPNAIEPAEILYLIDALSDNFSLEDPVLSIELDPRSMSAEWAQAIATLGVQRASMGVQTFAPHCQRAIGRVQDEDVIRQSVDWLRGAGVDSINFDLMYGLPRQSLPDLTDSLQRTIELGADRIALFGYAHVPHIVPRQRVIDAQDLPGQAERFDMAGHGFEFLTEHGYLPIGFDHFVRHGSDPLGTAAANLRVRRNFQGFTDDQAPILIGLGASAISSFPDLLVQNEKNAGRYRMVVSQNHLPVVGGVHRSAEDQRRGRVIEDLLCAGRAQIPANILANRRGSLCQFAVRGLVSIDDNCINITPDGRPYSRTIAALFDEYRAHTTRRFSAAV